jgi:hypothetical protein
MDKNQISQGAHASVLSIVNRPLFWARYFLLALFLAVSLASLQPRTSAQIADQTLREANASVTSHQQTALAPDCPACQQALFQCLANGGGSSCYLQYDDCLAGCQ